LAAVLLAAGTLHGQISNNQPETVELLNGMRFAGRLGSLAEIGPTPKNLTADSSQGITLIDEDLREVFVAKYNVANTAPLDRFEEEFEIWQMVHSGDGLGTEIGPILSIGPFDGWGRRWITIQSGRGPETLVQGITRINPRYVRVQGVVNSLGPDRHWDMYLALSSVPTDVLVEVLERQIKDEDDANERMRLVDFYVQARKYRQAEKSLRDIARDFPGLKEELKQRGDLLRGQIARQALDEARLRFSAGQPELAAAMIQPLENTLGIASGILVEIGDFKNQLEQSRQNIEQSRNTTVQLLERILASPQSGDELKRALEIFREELTNELGAANVERLSTFMRFADDPDQTDEQKISLALSGWVIGAGSAIANVAESESLLEARALVLEYLRTPRVDRRLEILQELATMETGAPDYLDKIVKHIKPPLAPSRADITTGRSMQMEIEIPGPAGRAVEKASYLVQLPPEYDPHRRYPCVVTLGGGTLSTTPEMQIDFWAGPLHPGLGIRTGQASRHGYIVIAPDWMQPDQAVYEYSAREHAVVLKSLRDACRKFSIDTDRVFLSGHFAGANAAWDIGQAHPEHWTGVIPISARVGKYINHYHSNGKFHLRWYFINGGRDFDSKRANATVWNKQMISRDFDSIVVHYKGRGTERFSDELPNLFRWMRPQRRQFDVRQFECATLRPWDNYFWWLEVDLSNNPKMILPEQDWNKVRNRSNWDITGEVKDLRPNYFYIRGARENATLWLSPGLVDFSRDVEIDGQSGEFRGGVQPSRQTLLEDVRTRADRQHPYWARVVRRNNIWEVEE
jgi:tetratricopeptide (TPR) repeat protein